MPNPAMLLHDLLARWIVPTNASVQNVRAEDIQQAAPGVDFWKMQAIAMGYVSEVERALDAIAPADAAYRHLLPVWANAVLMPTVNWEAQVGSARQLSELELGALMMLGHHLNAIDYGPDMDAEQVAELRESLVELELQILDADRLLPEVRDYLLRLISECVAVLDDVSIYGEARFHSISLELAGAMTATAEAAREGGDDETGDWLTNAVKTFVAGLFRAYATAHGLVALKATEHKVKELTQGVADDILGD